MSSSHKITRPNIDPNNLYGFVLQRSELLTLIAEEDDFFLDGYKIIRNSDIEICKATPSTRYCTKLMRKEGLLKEIDSFPDLDLTNWATVLSSLKRLKKFVTVEDEREEVFLIGPIRRINKLSVTVDYFDGAGKWLTQERIDYVDITSVSFDTRYISMHQKYIKKP